MWSILLRKITLRCDISTQSDRVTQRTLKNEISLQWDTLSNKIAFLRDSLKDVYLILRIRPRLLKKWKRSRMSKPSKLSTQFTHIPDKETRNRKAEVACEKFCFFDPQLPEWFSHHAIVATVATVATHNACESLTWLPLPPPSPTYSLLAHLSPC